MLPGFTYAEEFVKKFYEDIKVLSVQDLNRHFISERIGLKVFYWPEKSQALFFRGTGYIMLQEGLPPQQEWQNYLHELAHVLLHVGNQGKLPPSFVKYQEEKANQFMLHAAVPTLMLHELNLNDCTYSNIRLCATLFNVEDWVAEKRLTQYLNRKSMLNWNNKITCDKLQFMQ